MKQTIVDDHSKQDHNRKKWADASDGVQLSNHAFYVTIDCVAPVTLRIEADSKDEAIKQALKSVKSIIDYQTAANGMPMHHKVGRVLDESTPLKKVADVSYGREDW